MQNLLTVSALWQVQYQIVLIMLLKEFIISNVHRTMEIKVLKNVELNTKIKSATLNM